MSERVLPAPGHEWRGEVRRTERLRTLNFGDRSGFRPVQYDDVDPWRTQANQMVRLGVPLALSLDIIGGIEELGLIPMLTGP
jgi:hypothetical protein